ncbi:uncharacterized protein LOC130613291 isoform X1 [Hydractinia symbiolongicarpus]|uniref:uncharacterized protein LOC130613291 isoform X1 n=1 Tax=Hydractinia symbiolongicarpus TaxID=13093 RepID=UPI00254E7DE4|nr:uncharacterized protein LOC130613291 isoform X1 [Hydractinia symbiolongicarpus]
MIRRLISIILASCYILVDSYITRLPCKYHGNFSDIQYNKYSPGNVIKSIKIVNRDKCMIECVGESLCKACNYHSSTQLCDLLSSDVAATSSKTGSIYMRTDNTNRNRGPFCRSLNPCQEKTMCDDSCNSVGYECGKLFLLYGSWAYADYLILFLLIFTVTLKNVALQAAASLSTSKSGCPGRYAIDDDTTSLHYASTKEKITVWLKLDLKSTHHLLYIRVWRKFINTFALLKVGMSSSPSSNPTIGIIEGSGDNGSVQTTTDFVRQDTW